MSLTLSAADLALLEEAQSAIVSLLTHDDSAGWHGSVCEALRALVGADHVSLFESGPTPVTHLSTQDESAVRDYLAHYVHRDPVTSQIAARDIECGCSWDVIAPRDFRRTEFYADYVQRHALYDGLGYRVESGPESHTWLTFHFDREREEGEARRRAAMLRLLLPTFRAGVQLERRLVDWRRGAFQQLDEQTDGLLLCGAGGRVLHANAALRRVLEAEPDRETVHDAMTSLARDVAARTADDPLPAATRQLRTAIGTYALVALPAGPFLAPAQVTVVLQRVSATDDELRQRFGLTTREVQVARMLAQGKRNADLARELAISPSTARRHTERVMQKLGVESRAQVAARLGP